MTTCTKLRRGDGELAGWGCVSGCGACCWSGGRDVESHCLDEESIRLFRSMVESNGWCSHLDRRTRLCTIYDQRPDFCKIEASDWDPASWEPCKTPLQKAAEARADCRALIRAVYGEESQVLERYKREWPEPDTRDTPTPRAGTRDGPDRTPVKAEAVAGRPARQPIA